MKHVSLLKWIVFNCPCDYFKHPKPILGNWPKSGGGGGAQVMFFLSLGVNFAHNDNIGGSWPNEDFHFKNLFNQINGQECLTNYRAVSIFINEGLRNRTEKQNPCILLKICKCYLIFPFIPLFCIPTMLLFSFFCISWFPFTCTIAV